MSLFLRLAARVPLRILHAVGSGVGWLVYGLSPRFRKYLSTNLAQAGYTQFKVRAAAVAETGKAVLELPAIWLRPHEDAASLVRAVDQWHLVQQAMVGGKGVIILTPHLGCWEVAAQYFSRHYPLTVLYSPPKLRSLEPLMRQGRTRAALKSVPADMSGVRALYRALKRGEAIGVLPDQVPGVGEGQWTEFFGRPAYTMTLVMRMAESAQCPVLLACAERLPAGRGFRFRIDSMPPALPGEAPVRHMNRALELLIRRCPAQYLWAYNRYKVPSGVEAPGAAK